MPQFLDSLRDRIVELMAEPNADGSSGWVRWDYQTGSGNYLLVMPWERYQAEYERAIHPRITISVHDIESGSQQDPRGLQDWVTRLTFRVEVAQRLIDISGNNPDRTFKCIWDICDYLAGRLNRTHFGGIGMLGVIDMRSSIPASPIVQTQWEHMVVRADGDVRLVVNAQRSLGNPSEYTADFGNYGLEGDDTQIIESVVVGIEGLDEPVAGVRVDGVVISDEDAQREDCAEFIIDPDDCPPLVGDFEELVDTDAGKVRGVIEPLSPEDVEALRRMERR